MFGILNVHKPRGVTSHDVVDYLRRLMGGEKTGHCGTLDPAASGVLVICVGKATRLAEYFSVGAKEYEAVILLDRTTVTGDLEGEVTARPQPPASGPPGAEDVRRALEQFRGDIMQRPHRVSAVHVGGERLYERVRRGAKPVEAAARPVRIDCLEMLDYHYPRLSLRVECSTGTYVRQLAEDLGGALAVGGCLESLVRTRVGDLTLQTARTPFELAGLRVQDRFEEALLEPERLMADFGEARVGEPGLERVRCGSPLRLSELESFSAGARSLLVKVLGPGGRLAAVYRLASAGLMEPSKVLI